MHAFFDNGGLPLAMSHAGDTSEGAKAGSLPAYELAWKKGFRCFQIDVVGLANGDLIASHAITGRKRAWENKSAVDLAASNSHLHTVDEIVAAIPNSRWNLEIKSTYAADALINFLQRQSDDLDRFLISSPFRPVILKRLRESFGDKIATAASLIDGGLLGFPLRPGGPRADAVQLWVPLVRSQRVIDRNHKKNVSVQVWSVNKPGLMDHYLDRGIRGLITDNHDGLRERLDGRDEWDREQS